jgi:hypothetical protein
MKPTAFLPSKLTKQKEGFLRKELFEKQIVIDRRISIWSFIHWPRRSLKIQRNLLAHRFTTT